MLDPVRFGDSVTSLGYGASSGRSVRLTAIIQRTLAPGACTQKYQESTFLGNNVKDNQFTNDLICAESSSAASAYTVKGDSGGPLIFKTLDDTFYVVGAVHGGDEKYPSVYASLEVCENLKFVRETAFGDTDLSCESRSWKLH